MAMQRQRDKAIERREARRFPPSAEEMERFMDRAFRPFAPWRGFLMRPWTGEAQIWTPDVDMFERDGKLIIRADLPGMRREDIQVEVEGDALILRGQREEQREVKEEEYYCAERTTGAFYRAVRLPEGTDPQAVEATYKHGVLEVSIPAPQGAERKRVPISVK